MKEGLSGGSLGLSLEPLIKGGFSYLTGRPPVEKE
jgi:hypothetical protein